MTQVDGTLSRYWSMTLPRLLYRAATFKRCTDPRDKIYGLLGLAPAEFAKGIKVSYQDDTTAVDVFKNAALSHARVTERLENMHNCFLPRGGTQRQIPEGPSWVPDWVSDIPGETYVPSQFVATNSRAHFRHRDIGNSTKSTDVLDVLGVRFGVVSFITDPLPARLDPGDAIRHVRKWRPDDLDTAIYSPTGERMRKAYAITLICNGLREREPDWIVNSVDEWQKQDWDEALFGSNAKVNLSSGMGMRRDTLDALQCCGDRLFFRTDDGYMGLAPMGTRKDDVLAVFLGTPNAVVLRPTSTGDCLSIVGECFVYGLHDTIPLLGPLTSPWRGIAAWVHGDRRVIRFFNPETKEKNAEDPRLETSTEWKRITKELDRDDPTLYDFFKHKESGHVVNYDPRLEPEKLEARGVKFTWFSLI